MCEKREGGRETEGEGEGEEGKGRKMGREGEEEGGEGEREGGEEGGRYEMKQRKLKARLLFKDAVTHPLGPELRQQCQHESLYSDQTRAKRSGRLSRPVTT